jgi:hypothetical protein
MNRNTGMNAGQVIGTMNGLQVVGLELTRFHGHCELAH